VICRGFALPTRLGHIPRCVPGFGIRIVASGFDECGYPALTRASRDDSHWAPVSVSFEWATQTTEQGRRREASRRRQLSARRYLERLCGDYPGHTNGRKGGGFLKSEMTSPTTAEMTWSGKYEIVGR
jgi:hypothetical protein